LFVSWIPVHPRRRVERLVPPAVAMIGRSFPRVLEAAAGGDEDAFGKLWRDLQPRLLRYLTVVAPGAAEDLACKTWSAVVGGVGRFRGDEPMFRAWLFTIAHHETQEWRRRAAHAPTQIVPVPDIVDLAAPDDPAGGVLEGISTRAALSLIATLPPDQAEVIALRVVAGLDMVGVASIMGKRPGTVRGLAHRGLRGLAERLSASGRIRGTV
jgi:RNA polymerase sigma-70 factor (ECF subfamily)